MSLSTQILFSIAYLFIVLAVQAAVFIPLAFFYAGDRRQPIFRRDMATDLLFFLFAALLIEPINIAFLAFAHAHFHIATPFNPYHGA
jgi:hypothetical protein